MKVFFITQKNELLSVLSFVLDNNPNIAFSDNNFISYGMVEGISIEKLNFYYYTVTPCLNQQ